MYEFLSRDIFTGEITKGWKIVLGDNQRYALMPGFVLKTLKRTPDEDWKTAIAKNIPCIPKGTEIEFIEVFENLYGFYLKVLYNGRVYSILPKNVKYEGVNNFGFIRK